MPDTVLTIVAALSSYLGFVLLAVAFTLAWQPCCLRPIAQLTKRTK
ncbi:MAG: hypothetical protein ACI8WM_000366 [Burkholderiaceae bacterium]|jgi:hypothetical protein